jgi:hypothetical protein
MLRPNSERFIVEVHAARAVSPRVLEEFIENAQGHPGAVFMRKDEIAGLRSIAR